MLTASTANAVQIIVVTSNETIVTGPGMTVERQSASSSFGKNERHCNVMAGHSRPKDGVLRTPLVPAIHVFTVAACEDVDARQAGHDG